MALGREFLGATSNTWCMRSLLLVTERLWKTSKLSCRKELSAGRRLRRSVASTLSQTLAFLTSTRCYVDLLFHWFQVSFSCTDELYYRFMKVIKSRPVLFNFFSEAEPFAAILIAHGTHVFFRTTLEVRKSEIQGQRPRVGRGSWALPHQLQGLGERCKLPRSPTANTFRTFKSLENASSGRKWRAV